MLMPTPSLTFAPDGSLVTPRDPSHYDLHPTPEPIRAERLRAANLEQEEILASRAKSRARVMAIWDALPREIREFLANSPIGHSHKTHIDAEKLCRHGTKLSRVLRALQHDHDTRMAAYHARIGYNPSHSLASALGL